MYISELNRRYPDFIWGAASGFLLALFTLFNRHSFTNSDSVDGFSQMAVVLAAAGFAGGLNLFLSSNKIQSHVPLFLNGFVMTVALGLVTIGIGYTTAANSAVITASAILGTALLSVFLFKERFGPFKILLLLSFLFGVYLVVAGVSLGFVRGDLITLAAVPFLSIGNNYAKILARDVRPITIASYRFMVGVIVLPAAIIYQGNVYASSGGVWAILAGLSYWLGIVCFYVAVGKGTPTLALIVQMGCSIFMVTIGGQVFFKESVTAIDVVGIAILLGALTMFTRAASNRD